MLNETFSMISNTVLRLRCTHWLEIPSVEVKSVSYLKLNKERIRIVAMRHK